jgi:iron complex outermembrane receptor protein
MKKAFLFFMVIALLLVGVAGAQEEETGHSPETGGVFSLGEVVVRAKGDNIAKIATVETIDEERMDLTASENVSDAIDTLPGVFLSVGTKNERNFSVRGFDQRYVPVFYDGIPITVPNDGYIDTGKLPTANIAQITLTKGNPSVLYGPNAMGGVINILSKKPERQLEGEFAVGFREVKTMNYEAYIGSSLDKFYFTANGSFLDSDGFRLSGDFKPGENQGKGTRENSDIDQKSGAAKIGFVPAHGHEYALGINTVKSEWGLPPGAYTDRPRFWRFTDWEKTTWYLIGDSEITDHLRTKIRLYRDIYENVLDSYDDDTYTTQTRRYAFHSTYNDYSNGGSLTVHTTWLPKNTTCFSFHYKEDVHKEQDDYNEEWERYESEMFSLGIEDDFRILDNLSLVVGTSYDIQSPRYANGGELRDDDDTFNPQAGLYWTSTEDLGLHMSVGKKTRFPTLLELYSGLFGRNIPNPSLEAEDAVNYEIGAEKPLAGNSSIRLNLFCSDVKSLIVKKEMAPRIYQYQNIGKAQFRGLEASFKSGFFENNMFELHYTYLDARDRSPERTSDHLEENSEHKIYVSDLYETTDWLSFFAKMQWNSKRWYQDWDTGEWNTLNGFITVDLKAIATLAKGITLEVGVTNLFDENYSLSLGYPREGRAFFSMLRSSF